MKNIWYGIGAVAKKFLNMYPEFEKTIEVFADNDVNKRQETFYGKRVIGIRQIKDYSYDKVVICSNKYYDEMKLLLEGMVEDKDIISLDELLARAIYDEEILPKMLRIDASTICQLNCRACYMRHSNYGTVGRGYLRFHNFKKLLDENTYIRWIELSNSGEIFMNPELDKIIEYAHEKNVLLTATNGCNFNFVSEKILRCLVENEFREITLSIDGASQETYSLYRRNGDFDKVMSNVRKLIEIKKEYNSEYPKINWQYVIMESTESDIANAKKIANELNIPIIFKLTWDSSYVPQNPEMIRKETGLKFITRKEYNANSTKKYMYACNQLFISPQINWDGRLLGCCCVYKDDFNVNVFEVGLKNALKSENYKYAQALLLGMERIDKERNHVPCLNCGRNILTSEKSE